MFGIVDRKEKEVRRITYRAGDSVTLQWAAGLTSAGAQKVQWNGQPDGSVTVVWEETGSGRLLSRALLPERTFEGSRPTGAERLACRRMVRHAFWNA